MNYTRFQKTEMDRVCFGRSGIHGWGLFARRNIPEGEMVCNHWVFQTVFFMGRNHFQSLMSTIIQLLFGGFLWTLFRMTVIDSWVWESFSWNFLDILKTIIKSIKSKQKLEIIFLLLMLSCMNLTSSVRFSNDLEMNLLGLSSNRMPDQRSLCLSSGSWISWRTGET